MSIKNILLASLVLATTVTTTFAAVGDYKEIACTQEYFTANSCGQCFEGGKLAVGDKISGLYDMWTNKNKTEQIAYKDEQTFPEIVPLSSGTTFTANPLDASAFWKYGSEVIWTDSATGTGKQEFMLDAGKSLKFMEADLGAAYTLDTTDKSNGEVIALAKFPVAYHNVDEDGNEGTKETHIECVAYTADVAVAAAAPVVTPPAPEPKKMTAVKTGPESSLLLFAVALLLSALIIAMRNRRRV